MLGYALMGLAAGTEMGVRAVLIYMAIYVVMTIGVFVIVLAMRRQTGAVEDIKDLAGLARTRPVMAFTVIVFALSLAGVPPLAGFFGKFYVFVAAVNAHLVPLAVIGALSSAVGLFYYLGLVKIVYFDDPAPALREGPGLELKFVLAVTAVLTTLFFIYPAPLVEAAKAAASSFF